VHDTLLFSLWFCVTAGMLWSIRDQNAKTHAILREVQESAKQIARYLGTDRR